MRGSTVRGDVDGETSLSGLPRGADVRARIGGSKPRVRPGRARISGSAGISRTATATQTTGISWTSATSAASSASRAPIPARWPLPRTWRRRRGRPDILVGPMVVLPASASGGRAAGTGDRGAATAGVLVLLLERPGLLPDRAHLRGGLGQGSSAIGVGPTHRRTPALFSLAPFALLILLLTLAGCATEAVRLPIGTGWGYIGQSRSGGPSRILYSTDLAACERVRALDAKSLTHTVPATCGALNLGAGTGFWLTPATYLPVGSFIGGSTHAECELLEQAQGRGVAISPTVRCQPANVSEVR